LRVSGAQSLAVTGPNGSGKSTLMKIIAGVLSPTSGSVRLSVNGSTLPADRHYAHLGFVSPYLQLYEEFSAWENLHILARIREAATNDASVMELLRLVQLVDRRHDPVRTYSSGMKQRLKYASALLHAPSMLLLDEPTANLDEQGI